MNRQKNIIVIDDKGDLYQSLLETFKNDGAVISLMRCGSSIEVLREKMGIEDYLIVINEDGLATDIRELVTFLRNRLKYVITPIIVATDKAFNLSAEEQKLVPDINVIRKAFDPKLLRHHLINILDSIESNRNLNALSGLPGSAVIDHKLSDCLRSGKRFALMYIDLDNFKEYNEYYGFYRGDQVILFLTKILYEAMGDCGVETDFVGHVGGDDFIMIVENTNVVKEIGDRIIHAFDAKITDFYAEEDLKNGYIDAKNRKGEIERINIMSISIIVMYDEEFRTTPLDDIYKNMMLYKKHAKMMKGSVLLNKG